MPLKRSAKSSTVKLVAKSTYGFATDLFWVKLLAAPKQQSEAFFAFSRKHGLAVRRHLAKRQLRELLRRIIPRDWLVFFVPKKKLIARNDWANEIEKLTEGLLKRCTS